MMQWLNLRKPILWAQILIQKSIFACRRKSHSCTIQRHQALENRWPGLLFQAAFSDAVKPRGCISWPLWPLRGINKTAWGAKLILKADLTYLVSCASLGHLLMAQHCQLCLNVCFSLPMAPHPPPPPTPPPSHPPTPPPSHPPTPSPSHPPTPSPSHPPTPYRLMH